MMTYSIVFSKAFVINKQELFRVDLDGFFDPEKHLPSKFTVPRFIL